MLNLFIQVAVNKLGLMEAKFKVNCIKFKSRKFRVDRCKGVEYLNKVSRNCTVGYNMSRRGYCCSWEGVIKWQQQVLPLFSVFDPSCILMSSGSAELLVDGMSPSSLVGVI